MSLRSVNLRSVNLRSWRPPRFTARQLLLGGIALLTLGLLTDLQGLPSLGSRNRDACEQVLQPQAVLSREKLAQLLALSEGVPQAKVLAILPNPYCKLPGEKGLGDRLIDRQAYRLAFDPQTWVVVRYDADRYIGYEFKVR
jgi:hypothetical protein